MIKGKRGLEKEELGKWIIALAVLSLLVISSILFKDKLWQIGEYINHLIT